MCTFLLLTVVIAVCTADYSIYETTVGGTLDARVIANDETGDSHYETHHSSRKRADF